MARTSRLLLLLALLVWLPGQAGLHAAAAGGKTFFLSPRGDDAGPGTEARPWKTVQHAVDQAQPGDTIHLQPGVYPEEVHLSRSGQEGAPITLMAAPGVSATIQSLVLEQGVSHLRFRGFTVQGYKYWGIEVKGDNHHLSFQMLQILGGEAGVRLTVGDSGQPPRYGPVSHLLLEDCVIRDTLYAGVDGTPGPCDHVTIRRVEVGGAGRRGGASYGADGIGIEKGSHLTVEDCFVHDNGGDGIDLNSRDREGRVPGIVVRGNKVVRNRLNGIKLWAGGRVEGNAVWGQGGTPLVVGIFPGEAEISYNTLAYNMWAKEFAGRSYAATIGYPEASGPARPVVRLSLHHNIFAFNTGPAHGSPTGIYLGPGVTLAAEHHNVFYSRADNEIFLAQGSKDEGREISRKDISGGAWTRLTGQGKGDLTVDPQFLSGWPGVDLRLRPGSPAQGRGAY